MTLSLPSWRLARNSLAGRRGRTALMIAAVALASSLIVAVSCAIRSVQVNIETQLVRFLGATDARVLHQVTGSRFEATVLQTVRTWPEVDIAVGRLTASMTLIHADRRRDPNSGELLRVTSTALGIEAPLERRLRHVEFSSGRDLERPGEIVLDPMTSSALQAQVGDRLIVQRFGAPIELEVVGLYKRESLGTLQRPEVQIARETLAEAANRAGLISSVAMLVKRGVDVPAFCARRAEELPRSLMLEPAEMVRTGFDRRVAASRIGMTLASVLAFMSASFIIVTGMTTGVTERQREMAILRCVGAKRSQLFASQLLVGLLIGGTGALLGLPLGIALAAALVRWFADILPIGFHVSGLGLTLSAVGSTTAGLIGGLYPAWLAARVSPLRALAVMARPPRRRQVVFCTAVGLTLLAFQSLLLLPPDGETRFWGWIILGQPLLFLGYFLLAVPLFLLTTLILGRVVSRLLALPPLLLPRAVCATPFRHGFTSGALMVAMAILVSTWSSGSSILHDWLGKIRFADGFAYRNTGLSPQEQQVIAALPFVKDTCPIGYLQVPVVGRQIFGVKGIVPPNVTLVGFDTDRFFRLNAVNWVQGDPATAILRLKTGDAIIVADAFLKAKNIGVGDRLTLGAGRTTHEFEVVGVVDAAGLDLIVQLFGIRSAYTDYAMSAVFADFSTVERVFESRDALMLQVDLDDSISDKEATIAITEAVRGIQFRSGRWIKDTINSIALTILSLYSAVAFAALVIACLGVANVIIANIHGRQFEFGVIRAMGAHRGLLLRLILGEVILIALAGCLTGTLLGLHVSTVNTLHYRDLLGFTVRAPIPWGPLGIGVLVVLAMTILAASPAALQLMRRPPRVLLAAGRGG